MKKSSLLLKTTSEMFWSHAIWSGYYYIALVIIYIGVSVLLSIGGEPIGSFWFMSSDTNQIFMFIIGLIVPSFMSYFIFLGVTRENIFKGIVLESVLFSVGMVIVPTVLSLLISTIMNGLNIPLISLSNIYEEGLIYAIQIFSLVFLTSSLSYITLFLVGWFIGATFNRLGVMLGIGSILISIIFISFLEWFSLGISTIIPMFDIKEIISIDILRLVERIIPIEFFQSR